MLVYVDESGDTGIRGKKDSSEFFIVVAVIFQTQEDADQCSYKISAFRQSLNWNQNHEFKFNKLSSELRQKFLSIIANENFVYCSVVIDKKLLSGPGFKYKKSFYKYPIKMLFQNAKDYLSESIVTIDRTGEREFQKELEKYLKKSTNTSQELTHIKKVKMQESHRENLLQLADMICGSIARSLKTEKTDHQIYKALIIRREAHFQKWPIKVENK